MAFMDITDLQIVLFYIEAQTFFPVWADILLDELFRTMCRLVGFMSKLSPYLSLTLTSNQLHSGLLVFISC